MEKEEWINKVLSSTSGMQKAEPGPFLFEKISAEIQQRRKIESGGLAFFNGKWALGFIAALVVINGLSVIIPLSRKSSEPRKEVVNAISQELGYSSSYNY